MVMLMFLHRQIYFIPNIIKPAEKESVNKVKTKVHY